MIAVGRGAEGYNEAHRAVHLEGLDGLPKRQGFVAGEALAAGLGVKDGIFYFRRGSMSWAAAGWLWLFSSGTLRSSWVAMIQRRAREVRCRWNANPPLWSVDLIIVVPVDLK